MGKRRISKPHSTKPLNVYKEAVVAVGDFLAYAFAFSGWLNMNASRFCFLLAWVIMIHRLYRNLPPRNFPIAFWGGFAGMTLVVFSLIWWARPDILPRDFGTLISPSRTLLSPKEQVFPILEIGDSTTQFRYGGPAGQPLFTFFKDSALTIEVIGGKLKVSTRIRDTSGNIVVVLTQNEWETASRPTRFDRNYTDTALEVKDARDRVVLQIRILPDRIQLQGEWWDAYGNGFRIVKNSDLRIGKGGALFMHLWKDRNPDEPHIEPIFRYPSEKYLGELR